MKESELRRKACEWLKKKYKDKYFLEPVILHDLKLTVTDYLKRKFSGQYLTAIPRYNKMYVEPDIFGVVRLRKGLGTIIAECKVGTVNVRDFRQAMDYARTCQSYNAYLIYYGILTKDVKKRIRSGDHFYEGLNDYGKLVSKKLILVEYISDNTFFVRSMI